MALALMVFSSSPMFAAEPSVAELVERLGSPRYSVRESAMREIQQVGEPALPLLREQLASTDREVVLRAEQLVRLIERQVLQKRLLSSPKLRLVYRNTLFADVVTDVRAKTGLDLQFPTNQGIAKETPITLDTGEVPAFEAIDRLLLTLGAHEQLGRAKPAVPLIEQNARQQLYITRYAPMEAEKTPATGLMLARGDRIPLIETISGPVRIRVLPDGFERTVGSNQVKITLDALPLPSLGWQQWQGVRIDKAIDSNDRYLDPVLKTENGGAELFNPFAMNQNAVIWDDGGFMNEAVTPTDPRHIPIHLHFTRETGRTLKELRGTLLAKVLAPPAPVITIADISKLNPKVTHRGENATVQIHSIESQPAGTITVKLSITSAYEASNPQALMMPQGMVRVRGKQMMFLQLDGTASTIPLSSETARFELRDATGKALKLVGEEPQQTQHMPGSVREELIVRFQRQSGQGEPREFRMMARQSLNLEVPFVLKNVPLP